MRAQTAATVGVRPHGGVRPRQRDCRGRSRRCGRPRRGRAASRRTSDRGGRACAKPSHQLRLILDAPFARVRQLAAHPVHVFGRHRHVARSARARPCRSCCRDDRAARGARRPRTGARAASRCARATDAPDRPAGDRAAPACGRRSGRSSRCRRPASRAPTSTVSTLGDRLGKRDLVVDDRYRRHCRPARSISRSASGGPQVPGRTSGSGDR